MFEDEEEFKNNVIPSIVNEDKKPIKSIDLKKIEAFKIKKMRVRQKLNEIFKDYIIPVV